MFYTGYNKYTGNKTGQMTEGEIYGYYINNYGSRNRIKIRCRNQTACEDGPNVRSLWIIQFVMRKEAGFNKVVFIIRKDIFEEFEEIIGNRIKDQIDVEYVFQELDDLPEGFEVPEGRTKPWGTGQAVLCCKDVVKEPFVIINADDYYGKEAFVKLS